MGAVKPDALPIAGLRLLETDAIRGTGVSPNLCFPSQPGCAPWIGLRPADASDEPKPHFGNKVSGMSQASAMQWWQNSFDEMGVQGMERLLPRDATWEQVLQSGRDDFQIACDVTGMKLGCDRTAVEIGCGVGRMTQALGEHFGRVIGLDVAPALLEQARQQNINPAITYELVDGVRLPALAAGTVDTVFSYEVLYILHPSVFLQYARDIFLLLKPGGEFVFQLNLDPLRWTTRVSYCIRGWLWLLGIKEWRGWPTGPGFRRHPYTQEMVQAAVTAAGLELVKTHATVLSRAWFVAKKPLVVERSLAE